jgi:hypothetical protein
MEGGRREHQQAAKRVIVEEYMPAIKESSWKRGSKKRELPFQIIPLARKAVFISISMCLAR